MPVFVLYFLMFASTFKPVVMRFEGQDFLLDIPTSAPVEFIEKNSMLAIPAVIVLIFLHLVRMRRWHPLFMPASAILLTMSVYTAIRAITYDISDGASLDSKQ